MAANYKISYKKIFQVFFTLVVSTCCVIAMVGASNIESTQKLAGVSIHINSKKKYHFVEESQIFDEAIKNRNIDTSVTPIEKIDFKAMERVIEQDPWVEHATLYVDNNRVLQMEVTQRVPLVRVFEQNGGSCYMDNTLHTMPVKPQINFYTSVVTNVPALGNDSVSWAVKQNIATMVRRIQADTFWNVQISQVVFDSGFTFQLLPVLGDQVIMFGDTSHAAEKFSNLYAFYNKVLNRIGWDKYEKLDLRFKNQVIASPSLPYKGPVDKADANINWLNAYVSTEVRKDSIAAAIENRGKPTDGNMMVDAPRKEEPKKEEPKKDAPKNLKLAPKNKAKEDAATKAIEKGGLKLITLSGNKDPKKEEKKPVKHEERKADKRDAKHDDKKPVKHEEKKAEKHVAKHDDKKPVKHDDKKVVKHDDKPAKKHEEKKGDKKEVKKEHSKDQHAAKDKKHEEPKKEHKTESKPKEKAVLKQSELGNEKNR